MESNQYIHINLAEPIKVKNPEGPGMLAHHALAQVGLKRNFSHVGIPPFQGFSF